MVVVDISPSHDIHHLPIAGHLDLRYEWQPRWLQRCADRPPSIPPYDKIGKAADLEATAWQVLYRSSTCHQALKNRSSSLLLLKSLSSAAINTIAAVRFRPLVG